MLPEIGEAPIPKDCDFLSDSIGKDGYSSVIKHGLLENAPISRSSIQFGDFPASHVGFSEGISDDDGFLVERLGMYPFPQDEHGSSTG